MRPPPRVHPCPLSRGLPRTSGAPHRAPETLCGRNLGAAGGWVGGR